MQKKAHQIAGGENQKNFNLKKYFQIMIKNKIMKVLILSIFFSLASCAIQEKNDWVSAHGRYGQTWINGNLLYEIYFNTEKECYDTMNNEVINNINVKKAITETKNLALFCSANSATKTARDDAGLATGGLPYQGFIRLATSTEKYIAWFPGKKICEIMSGELKMQNKKQDLVCP